MEGTPPAGPPYRGTPDAQPTATVPAQGAGYPPPPPPQGYPQQQPQYGAQPQYGGEQQGPGFGDRASEMAQQAARAIRTPETKPFYRTSEFMVWALTVLGLLIAGAVVDSGDGGTAFGADHVWRLVTYVSIAYVISRGISKAGTKFREGDDGTYGGRRGGY